MQEGFQGRAPGRSLLQPVSWVVASVAICHGPRLPAQSPGSPEEKAAIRAVERVFKKSRKPSPAAPRVAAVEALAGFDSVAAAKILVQACSSVDGEIQGLQASREQIYARMADMSGGGNSSLRSPKYFEFELQAGSVRAQLEETQQVARAIGARLDALRRRETVSWMLETVGGSKKHSLSLKIRVARLAGAVGPEVLGGLVAVLRRARDPGEVAAVLDGIGVMGVAAKSAAPQIIPLLRSRDNLVQEHAALALSVLCDPAAIAPMIELLATSFGQTKKRVVAYLEALTRKQLGHSAPTWRRWFAAEGSEYLSGAMPIGGGEPSHKKATEKRYASYFGIPQDGRSIVYIIDASGTMSKRIDLKLPQREPPAGGETGQTRARSAAEKGSVGSADRRTTRLEACKAELIRALGRLEPPTRFNVIWFSDMPHQHKPAMLEADPANIRAAQRWVSGLQPNSSTNIYDSLRMAFQLTGLLAEGRKRGPTTGRKRRTVAPDTIFLLTDGSPTLPPGNKLDSTEKIIEAVREWNALKSVVIHTIGIGKGINVPFLVDLARENGGEFKQY